MRALTSGCNRLWFTHIQSASSAPISLPVKVRQPPVRHGGGGGGAGRIRGGYCL